MRTGKTRSKINPRFVVSIFGPTFYIASALFSACIHVPDHHELRLFFLRVGRSGAACQLCGLRQLR